MAEIDGGALSFKSVLDNDQLNSAINETLRRVQGFSDAVVGSGETFDSTSQKMLGDVRTMLQQIGAACESHEQAIDSLKAQYDSLGQGMNDAYLQGRDEELWAISEQRQAVQGEITVRKNLLAQLREQSNALEEEAARMEQSRQAAEKASAAHETLRTKIRNLREQMADLRANGIDENSKAYKDLVNELGRLQDIQGDIQRQGSIMSNDESQFAGVLSGLQGVAGAFGAAQSAVALFAGENENLQRIMLKVQSLMSLTINLQQVAQALNKDSAFSLVTLNEARQWWNNLLDIGRGKQTAATAATVADTAAQKANTTATAANAAAQNAQNASAAAGTAANITLAGAFRMVGAAIKSIPAFGWIAAAISGLVAVVSNFTRKAREAKKAAEELYKSVADNVYKPVASVMELQTRWNALGDDFEAKRQFVEANREAFDALGVSIRGVTDAENLLSSDAQIDKFVDAQIKKAEAMLAMQEAQDKVKTLIENRQKAAAMPDTESRWVQTSSFGTGYYVEVENEKKKELEAANDALYQEIRNGWSKAADAEKEGAEILKSAGIDAIREYSEGTLGALEDAIRKEREALSGAHDSEEYQDGLKKIEKLQAQANAITGGKSTSGGGSSKDKDPFLQTLEEYRAEYARFQKWMNSGDETLMNAARQEFAGLLEQGATYIDYLKNQREQLLSVNADERTAEQNAQLRTLNDSIAEESKRTVLEAFNEELSTQLTNAQSIIDMLNVIEQRRKELSNDGTDVDNGKKEILDDAEKSTIAQMQQETNQLLDEYASYVAKKKKIDEQYYKDIELLNKRRAASTDEAEQAEIDAAIANRTKQYQKDSKTSGSVDYDKLVEEYATFEQKKQNIIDEYNEKRQLAQEMGNEELVNQLSEAQAKALSKLATDELTGSAMWTMLFGNLDELTASQIDTLIKEIEAKFVDLSGIFDPIDLANVRQKLEEAKGVLMTDNPFKQLGESIKAIFNDSADDSKDSADKIKKNWKKLADATEASFDFVIDAIDSCDFLKDAIGDVGVVAIESMAACATTAISVATAIKTAEKASVILAIIQAALVVVQSVANVVSSIFGNNDKKYEKQIEKWQDAVDDLSNAYTQLSWEIDNALGTSVYNTQKQAIRNLQEQQEYLQQMWEAEEAKKKTDSDKVAEYKEEYAELAREIEDLYAEIAEDILQTSATDFADTLGDALVEAFKKGEDAADAFEETVTEILQNAIVNQLKKKFLEEQLQSALDGLYDSMGYWNGDDFVFDGLTDDEIASFKEKVQAASDNFNEALEIYKSLFDDLEDDSEDSLSGAVQGVTEETADIIAGQMNAIRINQLEATEVMRNSLQALNTIAANTQYNRYLAKIDRVITLLEQANSGNSTLRAQGMLLK